jgi:hypothetical protein
MKVTAKEVAELGRAISPFDTQELREAARKKYAELPADSANTRFRWRLYFAAYDRGFRFTTEGVKDAHIDTALRKVVAPL